MFNATSFIQPVFPSNPYRQKLQQTPLLCTRPNTSTPQVSKPRPSEKSHGSFPPVVFVLGGPGSGKGTQCAKLQRDFDVVQVCVGDLLRREAARSTSLGNSIADVIQRGEIVPGHVTMALLREELKKLNGSCSAVLIDGFPRAMDQAQDFEQLITICCFVLYFSCDEKQLMRRLRKRGKTSGRADDTEEVFKRRLRIFMEKTMPVVEYYRARGLLREVDSSSGGPDDVYERTRIHFENLPADLM